MGNVNGRNGHAGAPRLKLSARQNVCPKCSGCVLERPDPYVGRERYCVNCGWTPLTSLEAHQIDGRELARLRELRQYGRIAVFSNGVSRERKEVKVA